MMVKNKCQRGTSGCTVTSKKAFVIHRVLILYACINTVVVPFQRQKRKKKTALISQIVSWCTWMMKPTVVSPCASATKIESTNRKWTQWPLNVWSIITDWTFRTHLFYFTFLTLVILPQITINCYKWLHVLCERPTSLFSVPLVNYHLIVNYHAHNLHYKHSMTWHH